jgi:hypothetical protein
LYRLLTASATALSRASPTDPNDGVMPALASCSPYLREV